MTSPPEAKAKRGKWEGQQIGFDGIARRIERHYRRYRQRGEASSNMEEWLDKVMVEHSRASLVYLTNTVNAPPTYAFRRSPAGALVLLEEPFRPTAVARSIPHICPRLP